MTPMDDTRIFDSAYDDEDVGVEADLNNLETTMNVSLILATKIDKDHPKEHIIGDLNSAIQTSRMTKISDEHAMKVIQALADPSWVEAMQEELLQFKLQKVWTLVDLPTGKREIGTKWVFRNKKDERGIIVRNKARLFAQCYTQEEGINYDEVFAPVASIEEIRCMLMISSLGPQRSLYVMSLKKEDGIFISQDKYVAEILKNFDFANVKTANTLIETNKALVKDEEAEAVDVHLYRSMIGSSIYLKGQPKLGLWYPRDSPFDLEAFSDSDYAGASLDRKSTTGGCQFLGKRLISWQCKKQTIVANSTTKVEYVDAANCCGQLEGKHDDQLLNTVGLSFHYLKKLCIVDALWTDIKGYNMVRSELVLTGLLYADGQKLVLSGTELVLPGKLSTVGLPLILHLSNNIHGVAYLKRDEEEMLNFHQVFDFPDILFYQFVSTTVSPTIYASYIEQFWNTACLKTINLEKQIHADVDGKVVVVSESSVRRDLH
ncbi:putative ribonuclease H-like domain-containing protein [Tanacetum coccineum]|uniref:Ribonuclease H-like domain-containing protein n=1 Tax=Tanacetum coccineum TaxID=301880 RepID=A0ABQ5IV21_9ASTR